VSAEDEVLAGLPETPAGGQLAWLLRMIADEGAGARPSDLDRYDPALREALGGFQDAEGLQDALRRLAGRLGAPVGVSVERSSDPEIAVVLATAKGSKWTIVLTVEPDPPHRMLTIRIDRKHDFKLEVREASEADALVLADIERRCPIVMGDTSVWFERGASYFDFSRLMEDCTVGLASVDGVPAAVSCGSEHQVRVGGATKTMLTVSHLRVLPEHQRKGLWGAANSVLDKYWSHVDGSAAYISVDNLAMQHGFANTPDKWPQVVQRVELDCAALAGPMVGRAATPADAGEIVARLNGFHGPEEMFVPYTEASFSARMSRASDLYGWDKVWMTQGALVGVWPAGNALRSITETNGARTVTVPAVVLDYAFDPGCETDLEALLRAWCAWLAPRGMDTLVIYTSPAAAGAERLRGLARATGEFFTWTPGIAVPPGAETRGLYVDAIYF
jgi:hypothetical protein